MTVQSGIFTISIDLADLLQTLSDVILSVMREREKKMKQESVIIDKAAYYRSVQLDK